MSAVHVVGGCAHDPVGQGMHCAQHHLHPLLFVSWIIWMHTYAKQCHFTAARWHSGTLLLSGLLPDPGAPPVSPVGHLELLRCRSMVFSIASMRSSVACSACSRCFAFHQLHGHLDCGPGLTGCWAGCAAARAGCKPRFAPLPLCRCHPLRGPSRG